MEQKGKKIIELCLKQNSKSPTEIFNHIAQMDFIRMHGPEHHVLDGAALLTAFYNASGKIDLQESLQELMRRGLQMPGATCGMWGVCGAVSSMGAALSIIDGTGPLSADASWGKHMEFTSKALSSLSKVGGPRCCKRDAYLSFFQAVKFVNENYDVQLESSHVECGFSERNGQCIKEKCPFYKAKKKVAFLCVHNSCRSQIAEALGRHLASDVFESYSAGTETKPQINQDAVRIMKELYGIDMEQTQYSKLITEIPAPDIAISMGCNVGCPFIDRGFDDNWGLEDPTGKTEEEFVKVIKEIEKKILQLKEELQSER
jgi:protein-tyrosine-phosphatase